MGGHLLGVLGRKEVASFEGKGEKKSIYVHEMKLRFLLISMQARIR